MVLEDDLLLEVSEKDRYSPVSPRIRFESTDSSSGRHGTGKRRATGLYSEGDSFEEHLLQFRSEVQGKKRSTCLNNEVRRTMEMYNDSVLGMVSPPIHIVVLLIYHLERHFWWR